jgi:septal ring factor EnvC (AmiA/AmiB activator)
MSNESVDDLTNQLETLRIQEASVLQRLVTACERETQARARSREVQAREEEGTRTRQHAEAEVFSIGDRVQITNRVRVAFGRAATIDDQRATVTNTTPSRVYFKTLNGNTTWRARTNL